MTEMPHFCPDCGWTGTAPEGVAVLFHACRPAPGHRHRRRWILGDVNWPTLEDGWLDTWRDFAGGYKPPTVEEAQAETGSEGRRKMRERER